MNVLIDTNPLYTTRGGIARYVRGLWSAVRASPSDIKVDELCWPVENLGYRQPLRAWRTFRREVAWARMVAPRAARRADVLHQTALPLVPFVQGTRHVVTLHDLALLRHPERFRSWQRITGIRKLQRVAKADRVIAVSHFTADEAMTLLGIPPHKLAVIHEGGLIDAAPDFAPVPASVPSDFFLFVGALEPGKNLTLLREIYESSPRPLPPLLIAGARWEGVTHEGSPPAGWQFLGHVSDLELVGLYRRARALLFPSKYEGFGLPVVEAMALGCPVLCGPVGSLPEVGGEAVAFAELSVNAYSAAMHRLVRDDNWRAALRSAGFAQAGKFSWAKCAKETMEVYRSFN
jgi:glycosyltransferase involved in cell wall biosynthesis